MASTTEIGSWLERLGAISDGEELTEATYRVTAPSPIDFDDSIVRMVDAGQAVHPFGSLPAHLSVLCVPRAKDATHFETLGTATALGAMLTLALDRRVHVASAEVPLAMEGVTDQRTFLPLPEVADRSLTCPVDIDAKQALEALLMRFRGLPEPDQAVIGGAMELHYAGVVLQTTDLNAAYALVVAGIERLSREYAAGDLQWDHWEDAQRLDACFEELSLSAEQRDRLRTELLRDRQLRLRQTFAGYVRSRITDAFWRIEIPQCTPMLRMNPDGSSSFHGVGSPEQAIPIDQLVPREDESLRRRLLASYDARSSYVHSGLRQIDLLSSMRSQIPHDPKATAPLPYAALRCILRVLIVSELTERSEPAALPDIKLRHNE